MTNHSYEIIIEGGEQRSWADIYPDLLKSIYAKLPSVVEGTEFGSVCRNWYRVHCIASLSTPLPIPNGCYQHGATFGVQITVDNEDDETIIRVAPRRIRPNEQWRRNFYQASIIGRAGGWWLLSTRGRIFGFFNPLLRYPANYINLPGLEMHYWTYPNPWPIKVAFSAMPTAHDWMILVVYGDRYFSTLRRRDKWFWKTYDFSLGGEREQICVGLGYRDGEFFCLFESGDMLIFSIHEDRTRVMLATDAPLSPEQLRRLDSLVVVAECPGDAQIATVVSWERDCETREENNFKLSTVERETMATTRLLLDSYGINGHETGVSSSQERSRAVILVKEQVPLKTKNFQGLRDAIFVGSGLITFLICLMFMMMASRQER